MICGIGIDMVVVARLGDCREPGLLDTLRATLAASELEGYAAAANPSRFLAKRIAAKRALDKALDFGPEHALALADVAVAESADGPVFAYAPALAGQLRARGITARLSFSDERQLAIAVVIVERSGRSRPCP